jgi:hypothetical protein
MWPLLSLVRHERVMHVCHWCMWALNQRWTTDISTTLGRSSRCVIQIAEGIIDTVFPPEGKNDTLVLLPGTRLSDVTLRDLYGDGDVMHRQWQRARRCTLCVSADDPELTQSSTYKAWCVSRRWLCGWTKDTSSGSPQCVLPNMDPSGQARVLCVPDLQLPALFIGPTCEVCRMLVNIGVATGLAECRARLVLDVVPCLPCDLVRCVSEYDT